MYDTYTYVYLYIYIYIIYIRIIINILHIKYVYNLKAYIQYNEVQPCFMLTLNFEQPQILAIEAERHNIPQQLPT